jgi:N-acetyl-gamma-glutamyl-phosphate reductase
MTKPIHTAILGASGYTGAELLRLLAHHPRFVVTALTGDSQAGKPIDQVYPHLRGQNLPALVKHTEVDFSAIELVFCCLPHGTTQEIIAGLPTHVRIVDLSADFRLHDIEHYAAWYGHPHRAADLQKEAVYGITEFAREAIKTARLVANPGCYPTCSLLPLIPLMKQNMIAHDHIAINALSGISGAGRSAKQEMLFTELDGGVSAYSVGHHRHMAEIEQELELARHPGLVPGSPSSHSQLIAGDPGIASQTGMTVKVSFTPHLVPMSRGMLATITTRLVHGATVESARDTLMKHYANEPFVTVLRSGSPSSHQVRGTNQCVIALHKGRLPGELILVSVIDNLVKGASGQALQNANLMFGLPETTNLELSAVFP